uniref:Metalloendopeptidase n=1 Tax=Sinocyclocheilus rhinocerous TaxID=307959 RepID=A0A673JYP8_9TELE
MFVTKVSFGLLAMLLVFSAEGKDKSAKLSVSELLHRANRGIIPEPDEPKLMNDIAVNERNADPCTSYGCLWPKYSDGKIYVPYVIASHYFMKVPPSREVEIIKRGLDSFSYSTCIHFFPRSNERDYISIECYSYVGRQGYSQTVSLDRNGCLYPSTVQHELLHALDMKYNFNKINTLNQGTPYDYSSVMQYERYAFSKNGLPTMIPIPNNNAALGTSMSQNDIIRINRLYQCCECSITHIHLCPPELILYLQINYKIHITFVQRLLNI